MKTNRSYYLKEIDDIFQVNPVAAILGPRQCGKTTLAKMYRDITQTKNDTPVHYFDLEDPGDLAALATPKLVLQELTGLIIIDEIQRLPELFPILRVLVDNYRNQQKYLILGSASRDLIKQSSESLAGRITYMELNPFSFFEVKDLSKLWIRGGFPNSYLAKTETDSFAWRKSYIKTFLEQDIPNLGIQIPAETLRRFWMMVSYYHGNTVNFSEIGTSFGIADTTVRRYLDILTQTFMVRQLHPWQENIKKRQVKSPKLYFRDSGIFHTLLGINNHSELTFHPKLGASWEGFALEEIIRAMQIDASDCYFWGVHAQAELDLLIFKDGKRLGFEIKYTDAPKLTKSMQTAIELLNLDKLFVIFPSGKEFLLAPKVYAIELEKFLVKAL
jgi:predicted AAA+ superfamily ATPase